MGLIGYLPGTLLPLRSQALKRISLAQIFLRKYHQESPLDRQPKHLELYGSHIVSNIGQAMSWRSTPASPQRSYILPRSRISDSLISALCFTDRLSPKISVHITNPIPSTFYPQWAFNYSPSISERLCGVC